MNKLEATILDQHARVKAAGVKGHEVLGEAKGEVMTTANLEYVQEILAETLDVARLLTDPAAMHLVGVGRQGSMSRNVAGLGGDLYKFARSGFVVPSQGYVGLVALDSAGNATDVFGFSAQPGQQIKEDDPIQKACGSDFFYPPMMWAKALYSEAYNNRSESQNQLTMQVWLAELSGEGLFQGSKPARQGLLGATGFMPSEEMTTILKSAQTVEEHIESEPTEEFRASGLMDQAALIHLTSYPDGISWEEVRFQAKVILNAGGSLN